MTRELAKITLMPRNPIPDRDPVEDVFTGYLLKFDDTYLLTVELHPDAEPIISGECVLHYGVRFLGKPHLSIVPGLIALDYGEILTGKDAWDFLLNRSN